MNKKRQHRWTDGILATLGKNAGYLILIIGVFTAADRSFITPAVRSRAMLLVENHEKTDSTKWKMNDKEHEEIRSLIRQEFRVIRIYQKASMTEREKQKAGDELVNDTTIAPDLKLQ